MPVAAPCEPFRPQWHQCVLPRQQFSRHEIQEPQASHPVRQKGIFGCMLGVCLSISGRYFQKPLRTLYTAQIVADLKAIRNEWWCQCDSKQGVSKPQTITDATALQWAEFRSHNAMTTPFSSDVFSDFPLFFFFFVLFYFASPVGTQTTLCAEVFFVVSMETYVFWQHFRHYVFALIFQSPYVRVGIIINLIDTL